MEIHIDTDTEYSHTGYCNLLDTIKDLKSAIGILSQSDSWHDNIIITPLVTQMLEELRSLKAKRVVMQKQLWPPMEEKKQE